MTGKCDECPAPSVFHPLGGELCTRCRSRKPLPKWFRERSQALCQVTRGGQRLRDVLAGKGQPK